MPAGIRITQAAHDKLITYVEQVLQRQEKFSDWRDKLESIDKAYGKHEVYLDKDADCSNTLGTKVAKTAIKVPLINSEVDSVAAYLTKVFVNRTPLFPVLSDKGNQPAALALQALISKDARQQRWGRQLILFMTLAARYNVAGIEAEDVFQKDMRITNAESVDEVAINPVSMAVTRLKTIDMYNALFDYRVAPADIPIDGEYAGYNALVSKIWLKSYGNMLSVNKQGYNLREAYASSMAGLESYWHQPPDISDVTQITAEDEQNWFNWIGILDDPTPKLAASSYFFTRLYARIIPSEFGIGSSAHPTIVKLTIINMKHIISYEEVVTPLNVLPILFCDIREDGFKYQTKSSGENVLPYQEVATELLNVRLEGSKRALADRAIFDPLYLKETDVNSSVSAAKIPLKKSLLASGDRPRLSDVYYPIPFEGQGVINAMSDMQTIVKLKDEINGANFAFRGQQTPGNRTLGEFDQLNESSDDKALPYALRVEEQVMVPLKLIIKANILKSSTIEDEVLNPDTGEVVSPDVANLRSTLMDFKLTDGLRPKTAIRDPNVLSSAMQLMQNSEELSAGYNTPGIFEDIMGVLDIDISKHRRQAPDADTTGEPSPPEQAGPPATPGLSPG